jgi:hypothetical protein
VGSGDGVGVGVGDSAGGGGAVLGSDDVGGGVLGSEVVGVSLAVGVPAVVVVPPVVPSEDPPGGWLGSGVGVSDLVFVGDNASQMDGVGDGAGDEE